MAYPRISYRPETAKYAPRLTKVPKWLVSEVARETGSLISEIWSTTRVPQCVLARTLIVNIMNRAYGATQADMARMMNRDRTTVSYMLDQHDDAFAIVNGTYVDPMYVARFVRLMQCVDRAEKT